MPRDREEFYRRYLRRCNEHRFDDLADFVADDVEINDVQRGLCAYGAGLQTVIDTFPDFHWELRHLLVDGDFVAAYLFDTGTTTDGRSLALREFAVYRLDRGRIAAVWGDLDPDRLGTA